MPTLNQGQAINPANLLLQDGNYLNVVLGKNGEQLASEWRGKYGNANQRGILFTANVTAVTVPAVANNLVSVFTLFNPPQSGVIAEIVDFDMAQVLATTVVDAIGLYATSGPKVLAGTFTTIGVPGTNWFQCNRGADAVRGKCEFYSAYTHSGTPARIGILGTYGAVTNTNAWGPHDDFDGKLQIPPGTAASVAMSTAAGTASGLDIGIRWLELPVG